LSFDARLLVDIDNTAAHSFKRIIREFPTGRLTSTRCATKKFCVCPN
jgi:hypothetical protein